MRHVNVIQTVAPATEPITTADAKEHLRLSTSTEDDYVDALIAAARSYCEGYTRRSFVTRTLAATFAAWPTKSDPWMLPSPPFGSLTSLAYVDADGNTQSTLTLPAFLRGYQQDGIQHYCSSGTMSSGSGPFDRIPALQPCNPAPITVTYTAGYGAAAAVPKCIRQAMLLLIDHHFQNRSAVEVGQSITESPLGARNLLSIHALEIV